MATASPPDSSLAEAAPSVARNPAPGQPAVLAIHAEEIAVTKRQVTRTVQVTRQTQHRDARVEEALAATGVVIEHVPKGDFVDAVPPVREEGGVTILPVVEEVIVVERRLRLVEEVHVRRVQTTSTHIETVTLREQRVVVSRSEPAIQAAAELAPHTVPNNNPNIEGPTMTDTIVAVYDTAAHAEQAVSDLLAANVPQSAIRRHAAEGSYSPASTSVSARPAENTGGFWANLFGGGSSDHDVYDRTLESGGNVVSVSSVPEHDYEAVMTILEKHNPVDIDERAASYTSGTAGLTTATGTAAGTAGAAAMGGSQMAAGTTSTSSAATGMASTGMASTGMAVRAGVAGDTIQLAEEQLAIGKRLVNRGGTRVRRYVVETPVEQAVTLHDEKVTLERRPVTDGRPVTDAAFTDKTIEMTETAEEAVVSKTARVVEEVSLGKTATDRTETVRDTVRKEQVEVEQVPGTATTTGTTVTGTTTSGTTMPGGKTSGTKL